MSDTLEENQFEGEGIVGRDENPETVNPSDGSNTFLTANGVSTVGGYDENYGELYSDSNGVYVYQNASTGVTTIFNSNDEEKIVYAPNADGEMVATVYTTNPETTGYSVNTTTLGMGLSLDGNLKDPALGVGVDLDPEKMKAAYSSADTSFERDDVSSTANFANSVGDSVLVYGYTDAATGEDVKLFDTYRDYVLKTGNSNGSDVPESYEELWEYEQKYNIFDSMNQDFSAEVAATQEAIDGEWGYVNNDISKIEEEFKDAFQVGGLNISSVMGPVKEALSSAQSQVDSYLAEVAAEYSNVSAKKEAILAALAEEEKRKKQASSN